ncbi:MAG TPA: ATP-binding protein [bacterium]|nr:ATP-binding protein [bacterium]
MSEKIKKLIALGENETVEFKESFSEGVIISLASFANTNGGKILIGIKDNGEIKGITNNAPETDAFLNKMTDKLGINPSVEILETEGKKILEINIAKSSLPVSCGGKYYKRVGSTNREMKSDELSRFFRKQIYWDSLINEKADIDDIDTESVKKFVKMGIKSGRLVETAVNDSVEDIFVRLKMIEKGKLTNAAVILFGKDPQKYYINAILRIGRFKTPTIITGDKFVTGNLIQQVEEAEEQIKSFINVRYSITDKSFLRENIWDYPLEAIREMLYNAVVHRDYFQYGTQTQIKIFEESIWSYNPGALLENLTPEKLKDTHSSIARNPLIAHAFYVAGFIEQYGSGIERMTAALIKQEQPEPIIETLGTGFVLIIKKASTPPMTPTMTPPMTPPMTHLEQNIFDTIKENSKISMTEIAEKLNISRDTVKEYINKLKKKEIIRRVGTTKAGHWEIIKQ